MNEHERSKRLGRELADLRWHWDEAYEITWDGRFRARRRDGTGCTDAETAQELHQRLRDEYAESHD